MCSFILALVEVVPSQDGDKCCKLYRRFTPYHTRWLSSKDFQVMVPHLAGNQANCSIALLLFRCKVTTSSWSFNCSEHSIAGGAPHSRSRHGWPERGLCFGCVTADRGRLCPHPGQHIQNSDGMCTVLCMAHHHHNEARLPCVQTDHQDLCNCHHELEGIQRMHSCKVQGIKRGNMLQCNA